MRRLGTIALAAIASACIVATPASAKRPAPFTTGFSDPGYENPADTNLWVDRSAAAGAQMVLLPVSWAGVSPREPASDSDPSDPANPAYKWSTLDQAVRAAVARGLQVAFAIASSGGPAWADGPGRPAGVPKGTWEPDAQAFGAFAGAVARRYSGTYNPGTGTLPHVQFYQAWSEPNLPDHLNPQWVLSGVKWVAESPIIYRGLLNAFYAAVKSVDSSNVVVTGGTAPFGDPPGAGRVSPALFVRQLLCLSNALKPLPCPNPAHFDVLAHHPYALFSPTQPAFGADDVSVPDIGKLTRPLGVAVRTGRALPRRHKPVWVTEFSYNTRPPNPGGVPVATDAKWLEETFYVLWHQGVSALLWYLLVDQPCVPNCGASYQSGIYYLNGQPKPAFAAFQFPFLAERAKRGRVILWGMAPHTGTVRVQRKAGRQWRTVLKLHVRQHGVFTRTLRLHRRPLLRATIAGERSIPWRAP
jgi:Cellulase (glycosyl hydrolase family 5)